MTAAVLYQRMNPYLPGIRLPPVPDSPLVSCISVSVSKKEGEVVQFIINRSVNLATGCNVSWVASSTGGSSDLMGPITKTESFVAGQPSITVSIQTVKRAGDQGTRVITFTLSDASGCEIVPSGSTATCQLTNVDDVVDPPPGTGLPVRSDPRHPGDVPVSERLYVGVTGPAGSTAYATLAAAYAAVTDGQHIYLAPGNYSGFNFNRKFNEDIVIRSSATAQASWAQFTGRVLAHSGNYHWFYSLKFNPPSNQLGPETGALTIRQWAKVTQCIFLSVCGVYITDSDDASTGGNFIQGHDFYVGWNDFIGQNTTGMNSVCHIKMMCRNAGSDGSTPEFKNFAIYRNKFHDPSTGNNADSVKEVFNFYIGNTKVFYPDSPVFPGGYIYENAAHAGNNRRYLYFKRSVEWIYNNYCKSCKNEAFTQRHGWGSRWWANRSDDSSAGIILNDGPRAPYPTGGSDRNDVRGNVTNGGFTLRAGTGKAAGTKDGPYSNACDYALIVGNNGPVSVGAPMSSAHKPLDDYGGTINDLKIYQHTGTITMYSTFVDEASCDIRKDFTGHGFFIPTAIGDIQSQTGVNG